MTEFPQTAEAIRKILQNHNLTTAQLAAKVGLDRTFLYRCANGERKPGPLACVLLATLATEKEDRDLLIATSELDHEQLARIAETAGAVEPTLLSGDERQILDWWRNPETAMEQRMVELLQVLLMQRNSPKGESSTGTSTIDGKGDTTSSRERVALLKIKALAEGVLSGETERTGTSGDSGPRDCAGAIGDLNEAEASLYQIEAAETPPPPANPAGRKSGRRRNS